MYMRGLEKSRNSIQFSNSAKKAWTILIVPFLIFSLTFSPLPGGLNTVNADELDDLSNEQSSLTDQINQLNEQIKQKRSEKATLQNEVAIFDSQIYVIQLQIQATDAELNRLQAEIEATLAEITKAEVELERQIDLLKENLRVYYEEGQTSAIEIVASSDNFSEYMDRTEYLKTLQDSIVETVDEIETLKAELEAKKAELETKKTEQTTLKNQQVAQKTDLNNQRYAKQYILDVTKGEEAAFQGHLAGIEKELKRIQSEIWSIINSGNYISLGHVDKGSIIGYQGNTGYSTNDHLHFEIRNSSGEGIPPSLGNSTYGQPMSSYYISQGCYGTFSHAGAGGPCGLDMVAPKGSVVKAVADGEIIRRVTGWGNTYYTDPKIVAYGNYVIVKHTDNTFSMYAHLQ